LLSLAINTEQSIDSFLFYLIQYTITNLNIFLIILAVTYSIYTQTNTINHKNNNTLISHTKLGQQIEIRYIYELKGLFFTNPLLSLCLCISLFSMAGII
jgi:NADH-ubiquinone oxidoreductase chain 2